MKTAKEYEPMHGFYDLRAFDIPKRDFKKLWSVQRFLSAVETNRRNGIVHPQIEQIRELSGQYQSVLFSYPIIKPELI